MLRDTQAFSTWLYRRLAAAGWSQSQFAAASGVSRSAVTRWVAGERLPQTEVLPAIARTFGLTVGEMWHEVECPVLSPAAAVAHLLVEIQVLLSLLDENDLAFAKTLLRHYIAAEYPDRAFWE